MPPDCTTMNAILKETQRSVVELPIDTAPQAHKSMFSYLEQLHISCQALDQYPFSLRLVILCQLSRLIRLSGIPPLVDIIATRGEYVSHPSD